MSIKIKFTERCCQKLTIPTDKPRQIYSDTDLPGAKRREAVPGLQMSVFRSGARSFVLCRKLHGRTRFITLGKFPDMSVEEARAEAREHIANIRKGIDPLKRKRANSQRCITLQEVFSAYLKVRGKKLSKNTVSNYRTVIDRYLEPWKKKEMRAITRNLVQSKHSELSGISPSSANKTMRVLRALFNFANGQYENHEGKGLFPDNPVSRLSHVRIWNKETRRQNIVSNADIPLWFSTVLDQGAKDEFSATARDYFILLFLTGMRRREAAPLKWVDVNFKDRVLSVGVTKNGDPLLLPLSDYLYSMLRKRQESATGEYVFPGGLGNKHISEPKKQIVRIRDQSGIYFTLHDLRRTFITIAESIDVPTYALKKLINHRVKGDVTEGYIIMGVERLREPMQRITDYILTLAKLRDGAKVFDISNSLREKQ